MTRDPFLIKRNQGGSRGQRILVASPAKAGVHVSAARAADRWVPAYAGTAGCARFMPSGSAMPVANLYDANRCGFAGLDLGDMLRSQSSPARHFQEAESGDQTPIAGLMLLGKLRRE
jgi:hypothetical protein